MPQNSEQTGPSAEAIMAEAPVWQSIMALQGEKEIAVYLDIKSPHAYLAVRPSLMLARDYRVKLNFLPYLLSYVSLGVSTSVEADMKRRPASQAADRKARMYYTTARQYAALQQLPFRSPHRLLDTDAADTAFLFAKTQGLEVPFIMRIYLDGWGTGWRNYEVEDLRHLKRSLEEVGADTDNFDAYMAEDGPGTRALQECQGAAEASGVTGVPHYVYFDEDLDREIGLFGREHLSLIRHKLQDAGLARRDDVRPDFSHAWSGAITLE